MPVREHNGKVAVAQNEQRWCADGFAFVCVSYE
ncbi:putative transposase [Klebsiella pneumoniae]|nr:putative transposase [Klebsiella pneumoniae]